MEIELFNQSSDICDDFDGINGFVVTTEADIYLDNKAFGYYHAAWPEHSSERVDLVIYVVEENHNNKYESKVAIAFSYNLQTKIIEHAKQSNFIYNKEWCQENEVLEPDEIQFYSRAKQVKEIVPNILKLDKNIYDHIQNKA